MASTELSAPVPFNRLVIDADRRLLWQRHKACVFRRAPGPDRPRRVGLSVLQIGDEGQGGRNMLCPTSGSTCGSRWANKGVALHGLLLLVASRPSRQAGNR